MVSESTEDRLEGARVALVALVAAAGSTEDGARLCAMLMDRAAEGLRNAHLDPVAAMQGDAEIDSVCAACGACRRGKSLQGPVTAPLPRLGPRGPYPAPPRRS